MVRGAGEGGETERWVGEREVACSQQRGRGKVVREPGGRGRERSRRH